jgi:hypothetical protein
MPKGEWSIKLGGEFIFTDQCALKKKQSGGKMALYTPSAYRLYTIGYTP